MALKHLDLIDMVGLTRLWTVDLRSVFSSIPHILGWLSVVDEVHASVTKAQPAGDGAFSDEIAAIAAEQRAIDLRFDDSVRHTARQLQAEALLCRTSRPGRAAACERALQLLLPDGLTIVKSLYLAEAGHADRTSHLLASEPWLRELLVSIPLSNGETLLSVVEMWCELAPKLVSLECEKVALQIRAAEMRVPTRAEMLRARNAWLKVVNLILSNLAVVTGHDGAVVTLRAPFDRASALAAKRYAAAKTRRRGEQAGDETAPSRAVSLASQPQGPALVSTSEPAPVGMPGSSSHVASTT